MSEHLQSKHTVHTLDLNFLGIPGAIASYLIPHAHGAILVESGPGSTIPGLLAGLQNHGFQVEDVTDVLLTHIHLDHAGAAGWLANQGARIHVHPAGAPHMLDPQKLLASAGRIYGEQMHTLWGDFLAVPEDRLVIPTTDETIEIEGLRFLPIDTPGHANHHFVYLFDDICFSGDVGGVRMQTSRYLSVPMPPPEFILEKWRESLARMQKEFNQGNFTRIAPTHFGIFHDASWHLDRLRRSLDEIEEWIEATLPANPSADTLMQEFLSWTGQRYQSEEGNPRLQPAYQAANPPFMSVAGIQRYWRKYRLEANAA
jgi:glyoxylase-like metal-dependent hydrolase (beta-lactamase superfamily II)